MEFSPITEIIDAYKNGDMVIMIDDENRENEGDLLTPASTITAEKINFMAKHARGLICLTLTERRCEHLNLPLMHRQGDDPSSTNFTLSIEAKKGVTTGISAEDRAQTIRVATAENATAQDITCPGHIFPVRARDGGVLVRAGHTEAGCDLARLAGMPVESSVIVEIMKENGEMARVDDLRVFAKAHNIKLGTIESLIRYRLSEEYLIEQIHVKEQSLGDGTPYQLFTYWDKVDHLYHYAMVFGHHNTSEPATTWVRVHLQNYLNDAIKPFAPNHTHGPIKSWHLGEAVDFIAQQHSHGVVVLLNQHGINQPEKHNRQSEKPIFDDKNYGKGAQILNLIGVKKMAVLGSMSSYSGICGFGLEVTHFLNRDDYEKQLHP